MLNRDRNDDLQFIFNLVVRNADCLKKLEKILEKHIYEEGIAAIAKCADEALDVWLSDNILSGKKKILMF